MTRLAVGLRASETDHMRHQVERFLKAVGVDQPIDIRGLRRTASGASRENYAFDLVREGGRCDEFLLRRDPVGGLLETDRRIEFELLRALQRTALPVPTALWLDESGEWFERPALIMRRERGAADLYVLNGAAPLSLRLQLARDMCDLLAAVQRVDWAGLGLDALIPVMRRPLEALQPWAGVLRRQQLEPFPELQLIGRWLRENEPAPRPPVLVHGDFKPGNILLQDHRIVALLDWETAHLGDPLEDLGWVTQPVRHREHQIRDAWESRHLVARFEQQTGRPVEPERLRWWQVFACFKSAAIFLTGVRAYVDGRSDRIVHVPLRLFQAGLELIGDARRTA